MAITYDDIERQAEELLPLERDLRAAIGTVREPALRKLLSSKVASLNELLNNFSTNKKESDERKNKQSV